MHTGSINWGDAPTWLNVGITAFALYAAYLATRASWAVLGLERQREDRAERFEMQRLEAEERSWQADLVAAWREERMTITTLAGGSDVAHVLVVQNKSPLPVFDCRVEFIGSFGDVRAREPVGVLPPERVHRPYPPLELFARTLTNQEGEPVEVMETEADLGIRLYFTDTAGRVWERDTEGALSLRRRPVDGSRKGTG